MKRLESRIMHVLRDDSMLTTNQIAKELNETIEAVNSELLWLKRTGIIEDQIKDNRRVWVLYP